MKSETEKDLLLHFRKSAEKKEEDSLFGFAALSKEHSRQDGADDDHRLPYKRDVDRIIHSKAFARYVDKTQVAYLVNNDHITQRSLHVQLVSNFARGVAEILRLNLDLVEAIALGHDVGHPPFGHEGEEYLCELAQKYAKRNFSHPWQSCRLFREIEKLDLGLYVYDGFLSHDGSSGIQCFSPNFNKDWKQHFEDLEEKIENPEKSIRPASLEACLVKLCDTMSYLGKDIEDAINLGIISRQDVPDTILGNENRKILACLARDLIENSYEKKYIAISDKVFLAMQSLRSFNFEKIYKDPKLKVESHKVKLSYEVLFSQLLSNHQEKGKDSFLHKNFLANKAESYLNNCDDFQKIIDYISGMTDSYFIRCVETLIIPKTIDIAHENPLN